MFIFGAIRLRIALFLSRRCLQIGTLESRASDRPGFKKAFDISFTLGAWEKDKSG